jgi:hypothetical protein
MARQRSHLHRWHGSGRWFRSSDDNGSTTVEAVLVIPLLMGLLVLLLQMALWAHAAQVTQLAASEGDRSARSFGGGPAAGVNQADSILQGSGSDLASTNAVVTILPGDLARVTVSGTAMTVFPGFTHTLTAVVVGPIQEFRGSE